MEKRFRVLKPCVSLLLAASTLYWAHSLKVYRPSDHVALAGVFLGLIHEVSQKLVGGLTRKRPALLSNPSHRGKTPISTEVIFLFNY